MWKCHKCGKPVYFAERKQSLGYDWHPECLRCEECGKRLNPGQHAEHKSIPYCHVPCYGALFGPQLFGHGTRVESHKSFGVAKGAVRSASGPSLPRDHLESKLKVYNQYFDNKSHEVRSREVNGRLVLEGALRVYWAVQGIIHLKEDDDQRTLVTVRKRNSCRYPNSIEIDPEQNSQQNASEKDINDTGIEICTSSIMGGGGVAGGNTGGDATDVSMTESISFDACSLSEDITTSSMTGGDSTGSSKEVSPEHRSLTLPSKLDVMLNRNVEWDEIDDLLQVERKLDESEKRYQTMPSQSPSTQSMNIVDESQQPQRNELLPTTLEPEDGGVVNTLPEINLNNQLIDNNNCINSNNNNNNNSNSNNILNDNHINDDDLNNSVSSASSTLKNIDYDEFRKKTQQEYITNTNELRTSNDDTLKSNQPIDPSRINDSLKLYSENIMSKSYSGATTTIDQALRVCPSTYQQYQTINTIDPFKIHDTLSLIKNDPNNPQNHHRHRHHHHHHHYHNRNYLLQKSGSESSRSNYLSYEQQDQEYNNNGNNGNIDDKDCLNRGINRSKSGPNWYDINYFDMDNSETLKPSSTQKESIILLDNLKVNNKINIKMDCYDESTLKHLDNDLVADQIPGDGNVDSNVHINNINNNNNHNDDDDDDGGGSTTTTTIKNETENLSDLKDDVTLQNDEDFLNNEKKNHTHNNNNNNDDDDNEVVLRHKPKTGSTAIKRRSGNKRSRAKLKRRCSINGHFYNRETSFFTPPHGAQMSVWITSLVTTTEVVNLLLEKYKVDSRPENFALFILRDNGEQRRLKDEDFPLIVRVMLGPHEDIARIFLTDSQTTSEISSEVAQFLNLSIPECRSILDRYTDEMDREVLKIKEKYADMRRRITQRMESLKVRL